ncbi:hypothetical protein DY052_06230 [Apilactobacillus timberlakei]|nr:hypothetical protein DY052_06230 [Apilactobacillus timberlakei]
MQVKKVENGAELIELLDKYGYSDFCSFCLYPNSYNKDGKKEDVSLTKDDIEKEDFADKINVKDRIMFVGENAAARDEDSQETQYTRFQMMHNQLSTRNNDYKLARLDNMDDENIKHSKAHGSLMCDFFINIISTKLYGTKETIDKIENNLSIENIPNEYFDLHTVKDKENLVDSNPTQKAYEKTKKIKAEIKVQKNILKQKINNSRQSNSKDIQRQVDQIKLDINKNQQLLKNKLIPKEKEEKSKLVEKLYQHAIKFDIPAFYFLTNAIKPTKIITFGEVAKRIVNILNRELQIGATICPLKHFSYTMKDQDRQKEYDDAMNC